MTELRQRLTEAVRRVLPVDPDDGTVIVGYYKYGENWTPNWGLAEKMVGMLVEAVMGVVPPPDEATEGRRAAIYQAALDQLDPEGDMRIGVASAIVAGVERGLAWQPEEQTTQPVPGIAARWGCRCPTRDCTLRWDVFSDASADPHSTHRLTCITHSLVASSESARVADNQGMRQRAQALHKLDLAHQEQCR